MKQEIKNEIAVALLAFILGMSAMFLIIDEPPIYAVLVKTWKLSDIEPSSEVYMPISNILYGAIKECYAGDGITSIQNEHESEVVCVTNEGIYMFTDFEWKGIVRLNNT